MPDKARSSKSLVESASVALFFTTAGLIVTVATLGVAPRWKAAALVLGVVAFAMILIGARWVRWRLPANVGAGTCLAAGAVLLMLAPPPPQPEPQADLVVSKFLALSPEVNTGPRFDITLHNTGTRGVVLNELVVEVRDFAYLPWCTGDGTVQPSKPYPLTMPDHPKAGMEVKVTLHEEVPAGRVDRVLVEIGAPPLRFNENGQPIAANYVYRAMVSVTTDVTDRITLGSATFSTPSIPATNVSVWDLGDPARDSAPWLREYFAVVPGFRNCLNRNSAALDNLLDEPVDTTQNRLTSGGTQ